MPSTETAGSLTSVPPSRATPWWPLLVLGAILLLGLGVRLWHLGSESLWLDEGYTLRVAKLPVQELLKDIRANDRIPPLYVLALHGWIRWFGGGEFDWRLLSALLGFLTLPVVALLRSRLYGVRTGLLAALIVGVSLFHLKASQELRAYSLLAFCSALSMLCFVRWLERESWAEAAGYLLSSATLVYSHIYGDFVLLAQTLFLLGWGAWSGWLTRGRLLRWGLLQLVVLGLYIPWIQVLVKQIHVVAREGTWMRAPEWVTIQATFRQHAGSLALQWFYGAGALLALGRAIGRAGAPGGRDGRLLTEKAATGLVLLWVLTPVLVPLAISLAWIPVYSVRYTAPITAALCLLVARGYSFAAGKPARWLPAVAALAMLASSAGPLREYYRTEQKTPWPAAVAFLEARAEPSDVVFFDAGFNLSHVYSHYATREDLRTVPFPKYRRWMTRQNVETFLLSHSPFRRAWIVFSHRRDSKGVIARSLRAMGYRQQLRREWKGLVVVRFDQRSRSS